MDVPDWLDRDAFTPAPRVLIGFYEKHLVVKALAYSAPSRHTDEHDDPLSETWVQRHMAYNATTLRHTLEAIEQSRYAAVRYAENAPIEAMDSGLAVVRYALEVLNATD